MDTRATTIRPALTTRFYLADGWSADGAERDEDPYGVVVTVRRHRRSLT